MSMYFKLRVKQVVRETDDAVTIVFEQPQPKIAYKPGQFLTLILNINGENIRRSYSLCSAYEVDQDLAVSVKKVPGGKASGYLVKNVKAGDEIEVMQPMGTFTIDFNYHEKRDIILLGAGSGITPLISIAKAALASEPLSRVYLVYGNRNESSIMLKDKIEDLYAEHGDRFNYIHVLSQPKDPSYRPSGRLNRSEIIKILESFQIRDFDKAEYFVCGPEGMMDEAQKAWELLNVPSDKRHKESFLSSTSKEEHGTVVADDQQATQEVTIIYQGSEYKVTVPPEKTILEAALALDIDLPYSCQSGMCTACMGKCISGKVHLEDSDALSDKELEQGYVLTCVGHPVNGNVIIEID